MNRTALAYLAGVVVAASTWLIWPWWVAFLGPVLFVLTSWAAGQILLWSAPEETADIEEVAR